MNDNRFFIKTKAGDEAEMIANTKEKAAEEYAEYYSEETFLDGDEVTYSIATCHKEDWENVTVRIELRYEAEIV